MNEAELWEFIDASGQWMAKSAGMPQMTGRVLGFLLVCDPPETTAAQIGEALGASKGSISAATTTLTRLKLVDRLRVRGERADRFRIRPDAWDEQVRDSGISEARALLARGRAALAGEPPARLARLDELDAFYAWWEERMPQLVDEWQEYKRTNLGGRRDA
jgi:MarR family